MKTILAIALLLGGGFVLVLLPRTRPPLANQLNANRWQVSLDLKHNDTYKTLFRVDKRYLIAAGAIAICAGAALLINDLVSKF